MKILAGILVALIFSAVILFILDYSPEDFEDYTGEDDGEM